ncbi:hypothetical protein PVAP13_8NG335394 [Panicum virgatum]|uniref:Uncharacterized protein n=1 Tax=Panicum virgatum TaxID=38727 RepID=A0A8T0PDY4_PANVG|nr:hypothetical protein PVAP13_8NG335394 [Panicum virgatum]
MADRGIMFFNKECTSRCIKKSDKTMTLSNGEWCVAFHGKIKVYRDGIARFTSGGKVRITSHHECIREHDLLDVIDTKGIHRYIINGANVLFIRRRSQHVQTLIGRRTPVSLCEICKRGIGQGTRFCSLECKLDRNGMNPLQSIAFQSPVRPPRRLKRSRTIESLMFPPRQPRKGKPARAPFW